MRPAIVVCPNPDALGVRALQWVLPVLDTPPANGGQKPENPLFLTNRLAVTPSRSPRRTRCCPLPKQARLFRLGGDAQQNDGQSHGG